MAATPPPPVDSSSNLLIVIQLYLQPHRCRRRTPDFVRNFRHLSDFESATSNLLPKVPLFPSCHDWLCYHIITLYHLNHNLPVYVDICIHTSNICLVNGIRFFYLVCFCSLLFLFPFPSFSFPPSLCFHCSCLFFFVFLRSFLRLLFHLVSPPPPPPTLLFKQAFAFHLPLVTSVLWKMTVPLGSLGIVIYLTTKSTNSPWVAMFTRTKTRTT